MKIALLAPAGAMHRHDGMFHKNLHYAPITLALLAALVPAELEAEVEIYDETAEPIPLSLVADIVAITCITGTAPRCYRFADYFRSRGAKVLLGGVHPSLLPEEAAAHCDAVIVGLGEETFVQALLDLQRGEARRIYRQPPGAHIEGRPLPRKDLLRRDRYCTLNTVEAIRGCCHRCDFCAYPQAFGETLHKRRIEEIVAEIRTFKGKLVLFPDVNLISDIVFAKALFRALRPLHKWWFALTTSAVGMDEELVALMADSGCKGLLIGFESVNQAAQANLHKRVNRVNQYAPLMELLHARGIMVMGCFAFGNDADGPDVFDRTVEMCVEAKIDLPRFSVLTPFPGTELYRKLESAGRITERDWSLYDVEHVVFRPAQMTAAELEAGIARAWKKAYSWKNIWRRMDWRHFCKIHLLYAVFWAANIGYRRYAQAFSAYGKVVMTDNSDIPAGATMG